MQQSQTIQPEKYTENAAAALSNLQSVVSRYSQQVALPEHLLLTLLEDDSLVARIIELAGGNVERLASVLDYYLKKQPRIRSSQFHQSTITASPAFFSVLGRADVLRKRLGDDYISVEHLLIAIASEPQANLGAGNILASEGLTPDKLNDATLKLRGKQRVATRSPEATYESLEKYGVDLTAQARSGKLDPVIGRDVEVRRAMQILSRRNKNNPVLIGSPGVGKTAIAEGLANRIVAGDVPESLLGFRVVSVDLGTIVAGAKMRGEFEERLKAVLKEASDPEAKVILFIDEIHTLIGAGSAGDSNMDAGNMLKPLLARGELRVIGATTLDEYRKYIEKDAALERRLQKVLVEPPSVAGTVAILRGLKERYEVHHGVRITDGALLAAASLSDRYIADRFLPDKAIDLVDEASASLKMQITSRPQKLDEVERKLLQLEMEALSLGGDMEGDVQQQSLQVDSMELSTIREQMEELKQERDAMQQQWEAEKSSLDRIRLLKEEIEEVLFKVEELSSSNDPAQLDLSTAAQLKYETLPRLQAELKTAEKQAASDESDTGGSLLRDQVRVEDIAQVVSTWTGVPVAKLQSSDRQKILSLGDDLKGRVVGQEAAVQSLVDAVQRSRAGVSDPTKPIASLMFLGPTGVGKTELCKALAASMFDNEENIVRIDMSEYMDKHSVSRLIGAPPGYVGYEEGGQLSEAVRRRPYSVVLFDEMDKAHVDVFNILLQILDDGRVTDSQGRTVDFRNTVIILTSNIGSQDILNMANGAEGIATAEVKQLVMNQLKAKYRPEFLNRLDEYVIFQSLQMDQLKNIVRLQMDRVNKRMADRHIVLVPTADALEFLVSVGADKKYGARPLKRAVQRFVETPLAKLLLEEKFANGDKIEVGVSEDGQTLVFNKCLFD